jgi:hypothetical protein
MSARRRPSPTRAAGSPTIEGLLEGAYADGWNPLTDLPWGSAVDWRELEIPDQSCLLAQLPAYRKMSAAQRARVRRREMASHLSGLAFGERHATTLAAETILLCPEDEPQQAWFLATLMADEAKHASAIDRYQRERLGARYPPHPALVHVFNALSEARDYELNLLVGQVVLEGSAASLLTSLMVSIREPLLRDALRRIMRDEARHMKFAETVTRAGLAPISGARRKRMEEILFDAAFAGAASLLAPGVWDEVGLARPGCLSATVDELKRRGIIRFYSTIVTRQLRRRGFPTGTLEKMLERLLEGRLRSAA